MEKQQRLTVPEIRRQKLLILKLIRKAQNIADCRIAMQYLSNKFRPRVNEYVDAELIDMLDAHKHVQYVFTALHNKIRRIYISPEFRN